MISAKECFSLTAKVDVAALFKKLGLTPADERPILAGWREANTRWRQWHREQIAEHARRVLEQEREMARQKKVIPNAAKVLVPGRRRAVWCVELQKQFRSLSEAARFVNRKPNNISQAMTRGGRCGRYHWEEFKNAKDLNVVT